MSFSAALNPEFVSYRQYCDRRQGKPREFRFNSAILDCWRHISWLWRSVLKVVSGGEKVVIYSRLWFWGNNFWLFILLQNEDWRDMSRKKSLSRKFYFCRLFSKISYLTMFLSVNSHVLWTLTLENGLTACRNHYLYWPKHVEAIISLLDFSLLMVMVLTIRSSQFKR